jgi:hypothetical protein
VLRGHTGTVRSVAFSHDGRTVVSSSDDKTVKVSSCVARAPPAALAWTHQVHTPAYLARLQLMCWHWYSQ